MGLSGMIFRSLKGSQGQITVPGLGAVVAEFQSWTLKRHEESRSASPIWTLHAVFRYQNDLLLKNDSLKKKIRLQLNDTTKIDICNWKSMRIDGVMLIVEGAIQCPTT
jgi:hypothetical protein